MPESDITSLPKFNLESLTKAIALSAFALYSGGFLALSIYHAHFGFHDLSPLKPGVMAAGAWLFVVIGVPSYSAYITCQIQAFATTEMALWAGRWTSFYWVCWLLTHVIASEVFQLDTPAPLVFGASTWHRQVVVMIFALVSLGISTAAVLSKKPRNSRILATLSIAAFLPVLVYSWPMPDSLSRDNLALLMFGYGLAYLAVARFLTRSHSPLQFWLPIGSFLIPMITSFALLIYPHIRAAWGGGSPTDIILYMSKDSRLAPNGQLQAMLVDETESGLYVVLRSRRDAIFLPRAAVASVVYSNAPLDTKLLQ